MSPELFVAWIPAFFTTILVETPIYALMLASGRHPRLSLGPALVIGVALQAVTHPLFWLSWDALGDWPYAHYELAVTAFELVITLSEALLVLAVLPRRRPWHRLPSFGLALLAAVVANLTSIAVGYLA